MSSKHKQSNTSIRLVLILVALTVVAAIFYPQNKNGTDSTPSTSESAEIEPVEVEENKKEQNLVAEIVKEKAIEDTSEKDFKKNVIVEVSPTPPFVETIRVETDGAVVLAGRSDPNAEIKILLDEAVINSVQADASGNFVALFDIGMSTEIRVMSLLAIVDSIEVYAEEDIIIAAAESAKTTLADERVVAKAETDVGDETRESQGAETPSEEKSPKKTIVETKAEEVAEVLEEKSDTKAEQKKDLAESEKKTAASLENESVQSISVKTKTSQEEETNEPVAPIDDAAASSTNIITTVTETAGKVSAKADETVTTKQEKVVILTEKEGNGETSKQKNQTSIVITDHEKPFAGASGSVVEKDDESDMSAAETVTVQTQTEPKSIVTEEQADNDAPSVKKTVGEDDLSKTPVAETVTVQTEKEPKSIFAEKQADNEAPSVKKTGGVDDLSEMPVAETVMVQTETEPKSIIPEGQADTEALSVKKTVGVDDVSEMAVAETVTVQTETEPKSIVTEAQADNEAPSVKKTLGVDDVSEIPIAETMTVQTETKPKSTVTEAQADNEASSVKKTVGLDDVSEIPVAETVTLQTETEPKSIVTVEQVDNEATSLKKAVEEDAEEERVEEELLVVIAGKDSVKVVQSLKKGTAKDVSVDAISYDETGDVALTGRGNPSQMVRIYLDNMPVSTVAMDATGQWSTALSEIDAGIYTLRVDELDSAGNVVSRLETPFKREKREDLAAYMIQVDEPARINVVTVQPGNTLWAIARERYGQGILYVRVFEQNKDKIRDPDLIYPGQVFSLPDD